MMLKIGIIGLLIMFALCTVAGAANITLRPGQKLTLQDGSYLALNGRQLTLFSKSGNRTFPAGSRIEQTSNRISIWGSGGTTLWQSDPQPDIPGTKSFDDPLLQPKSFDDPLLKPKSFDDPLLKPKP